MTMRRTLYTLIGCLAFSATAFAQSNTASDPTPVPTPVVTRTHADAIMTPMEFFQSSFPGRLPNGCSNNQIAVYHTATHTWDCGSGSGTGTVTSAGVTFTGGLITGSGSPITSAGTVSFTVAGTSGGVPYFSSTSTWASSGLLAANALMIGGGAGAAPATTTTGTGVITALGNNTNASGGFVTSPVPVANGGTALTSGTSGGVLAFTASGTLASSGALTANLPVIGGGAGAAPTVGTRSGNTTTFVTTTGTQTSGRCVVIDANGNHVADTGGCNTGSGIGGSTGSTDNALLRADGTGGSTLQASPVVVTDAGAASGFTTVTGTGAGTFAGLNQTYVTKTGNYTLTATDGTVELLTNAGTLTLPTAVGIQGRMYRLKNLQTANALTIATASSQTVDGASPGTISNGCLDLQSDGANWRIIGACGLPLTSLTSGGVIYASSTTSVASSALLAANALVIGGGAGTAPATTTTGTGVLTALGVNVGSTGAFVAQNGALGTPSSGTLNLPFHMLFLSAVCQNATASVGGSTPTTLGAAGACVSTSAASGDPAYGTATFVTGGADTEWHGHFPLPSDWTGAVDLNLKWNSLSNASGDVVWQVQFGCTATGEVPTSISFNNSVFTATANQTSPTAAFNLSSKTGITTTGCAAGEEAFFIVHRDTDTSGDTLDQDVQLITIDFVYRRAVVIGG